MKNLVLFLVLTFGLMSFGQDAAYPADKKPVDSTPKLKVTTSLTDSQKLKIRNSQLAYFTSKAQSDAADAATAKAQENFTQVVREVYKEAGLDPEKINLDKDLNPISVEEKAKK